MMRVLIVGAGITGAATSALLRKHLPKSSVITIWEKSKGSGGRMSTSRSPENDACTVDLGAQYFTLFPEYREKRQKLFDELVFKGILQPLTAVIEGDKSTDCKHYVATSGSGSLVKHYIQTADCYVKSEHLVTKIDYSVGGAVTASTESGEREEFDAVVVTVTVPQILNLQGDIHNSIANQPEIQRNLESVSYSSRFCLGLFYKQGTTFPYSWAGKYFYEGPCIRFVSIDNQKRGMSGGSPSIVVHTSVPFSLKHLEMDKEDMKPVILQHLEELLPDLPKPDHVKSHKWRFSQVFKKYPGAPGCVVLEKNPPVVLAGDAFAERGNFTGTIDSSEATAQAVLKCLHPDSKH